MITKDYQGKPVVECDNCGETCYQDDPEQDTWFLNPSTVSGRNSNLDLCHGCGMKLTNDDCKLPDDVAESIQLKP